MKFFTADNHFGHKNVISFTNRPFATTEQMDAEMIERWNSRVKYGDYVYVLGDFIWSTMSVDYVVSIIKKLNGSILLVRGSHDRVSHIEIMKMLGVKDLGYMHEIKIHGYKTVLCHYSLRTWPASHFNSWHLFGHSHQEINYINSGKSFDVGVEGHDFYPWSEDEIHDEMLLLRNNFGRKFINPNKWRKACQKINQTTSRLRMLIKKFRKLFYYVATTTARKT